MSESIDIDNALFRVKSMRGVSKDKEIAELLDLSPQDFSNRKKRGTLIEPIVKWGINENVDFNWLLTGEGSPGLRGEGDRDDEPVDLVLIGQIIEHLEELLQEEGTNLPPTKKRRLIELLYKHFKKNR